MIKRIAALAFVVCFATSAPAAITLIKAGRLLDPRSGNVLSSAAVLIDGDKIKEVGPASQVQAHANNDTRIIELGNATLLPGLIDSHTHCWWILLRR